MKTATVSGLVTDSSGAVVLGAEVQLQSLDRGTVKTGKDGRGVSRAPLPPHSLKSTGGSPLALFKQHELPANRRCFRLPHTTKGRLVLFPVLHFIRCCGFRKLWRANSGNSGTVCRSRQCLLQIQMTRPPGGSIEVDEASTLQDSIQNGGRQILVVQHLSPRAERLVRGENDRPLLEVAMVHHMVQHIGGIGSVR